MPEVLDLKTRATAEVMSTYPYWQHFLALEADFAATSRYVEFSKQNFATFSIEYAKLLLAIGSEIDVLCKIICAKLESSARAKNICDYRACIVNHSKIVSEEVLIRRYNLAFKPWNAWEQGKTPTWWHSYNEVKHHRDEHFNKANLACCAAAISGLFVLVIYCHKAENSTASLEPYPILLGRKKEPGSLLLESGYSVSEFT